MGKHNRDDDLRRTIVRSRTYGTHDRARRGTNKKAELNDTLKLHTLLMADANTPARLVKNEIDYHRAGFPSGQLWQRLVGMFKKQLKLKLPLNVDELLYLDVSKDYPMSALLKRGFNSIITFEETAVKVDLQKLNPQFRRKGINGYQVEVAVMYFDFVRMESRSDSAASPVVPLDHPDVLSFELEKGEPGDRYLISFKISGSYQGDLETGPPSMAMKIIQTGIVSR